MELRYCLPGCRWSLCACVCVYVVYLCVCTCICLHVVYLFVCCVFVCLLASETLSGVTQLKIGDVCYLDVRMSFCTLTLAYFCVRSVFDPVPNFTKQNPPV